MNDVISAITFGLSWLIIIGIISTLIYLLVGKKKDEKVGIGLEKFYPLLLFLFLIFLIPLVITGKISEATFSTFFGIIIGVFVTAFKDIVKAITKGEK